MHPQRASPRAEYRQQEVLRTNESTSLAAKFPRLKSLTVDISCFNPQGINRCSQIKYTVNLANAKSVFRIDCPNNECVGGDFDLSAQLADAVTAKHLTLTGEMCCQGWTSKTTIGTTRCLHILRYTFTLGY